MADYKAAIMSRYFLIRLIVDEHFYAVLTIVCENANYNIIR